MLSADKTPEQAAQPVRGARQTAYPWKAVLDEGGIDALRTMPVPERPARLDDEQLQASARAHVTARNKLKSAQPRPSIIAACWVQAGHWGCRHLRNAQ
jgi:hypothetical protein